ncbi:NAD(P)H-binding protein [Nocardia wallacei]|uniref:NAD(P)H-binding protein n=1 Tax=Nocardia wallacei TaxID=480035 RepID=UPI002458E87F|nr:NAD(P)H-binding protein [Nocardia wallacei]
MIVVTGATGTVGRAVVDQLLARGARVRAVARRPQGAGLPDGAEPVRADLGEPEGLAEAFAGADRVFLLSAGPDIPRHDRNVAKAAAHAGVAHIVKLSSGRAGDEAATDPIPMWHRAGERAVREAGTAWTMVRPLGFMSNALHWASTIRGGDTVYAPYGQGRIAVVDPHDIAAVATTSLTEPGHEGRTYTLSGPRALSPGEQTEILAEVLGRPLRYEETTPDQARAALLNFGVDTEMADAIMALRATALESFTSRVHPTVEEVTGRSPRTFSDWALGHRADFE